MPCENCPLAPSACFATACHLAGTPHGDGAIRGRQGFPAPGQAAPPAQLPRWKQEGWKPHPGQAELQQLKNCRHHSCPGGCRWGVCARGHGDAAGTVGPEDCKGCPDFEGRDEAKPAELTMDRLNVLRGCANLCVTQGRWGTCRLGHGVAGAVLPSTCNRCTDFRSEAGLPAPTPPDGPPASVLLHAYLRGTEGYGRISRALGQGLESIDIPARYLLAIPLVAEATPDTWTVRRIVTDREATAWPVSVQVQVPETMARPGQRRVAFTMTESTGLRPDQLAGLNAAELILVPSRQNVEWFQAAGVRPPVRRVPLGLTDPELFAPRVGWIPSGPTRIGMAGRQAHGVRRKNLQAGIDAFLRAFGRGQDVRLEVLSTDTLPLDDHGDPRIKILREPISSAAMGDWYRTLDAFLSPTRGEGWGMHQHESMACGVPQIAPIWGGLAEFLEPDESYPIDFTLAPTEDPRWAGEWAEPSFASMVARIRAVADDRDEAARRGRLAGARAHAFDWQWSAAVTARTLREFGMLAPATLATEAA